jgi:hypothetical protein
MSNVLRVRALSVLAGLAVAAAALPEAAVAEDTETFQPNPFVRSEGFRDEQDVMVPLAVGGDADKRIGAILARHPDRDLVICLAGCGGGPKLVAVRAKPAVANADAGRMLAPAASALDGEHAPRSGDVICLAGCVGAPGETVHRGVRLAWVGEGASLEIKAALRAVAARLLAEESALRADDDMPRTWVSAAARRLLVEGELPGSLATLVGSAGHLARHASMR